MDENQVEYVTQVFNHIQATANSAGQERTLDIGTLLQAIRNFYVSLFSKNSGMYSSSFPMHSCDSDVLKRGSLKIMAIEKTFLLFIRWKY